MRFLRHAALAALLVFIAIPRAHAIDFVDRGAKLALAPGEGVVVLSVRSLVPIQPRISGDGRFVGGSLGAVAPGGSYWVIRAPEGTYRWNRFTLGDRYWDMRGDDDYSFQVKAGVVSYPGDFDVKVVGGEMLAFDWQNRASEIMALLDKDYTTALAHLPFRYSGRMPDAFPDFFRAKLKAANKTADTAAPLGPMYQYAENAAPLPAQELFRRSGTQEVTISPDGARLAEHAFVDGKNVVRAIDVASGASTEIYAGSAEIGELRWIKPGRLAIEFGAGLLRNVVLHDFSAGRDGKLAVKTMAFPVEGTILNVSRANPDQVVFLRGVKGDPDPWQLYRVDIGGKEVSRTEFQRRERLDNGLEGDSGWLVDDAGLLRVVVAKRDGRYVVLYREDARPKYRELLTVPSDRTFAAQLIDAQGRIVAITDVGRAQRDLVAIDANTGQVVDTLYSRPRADIASAIIDPGTGRIVGVRYLEGGALATHYLADAGNSLQAKLQASFKGRQVAVLQSDASGTHSVVGTMGPTDPGHYYLFDAAHRTLEEVGQVSPQLANYRFAEPQVFTVRTRDGFDIESILFMPQDFKTVPLVVMPHGGPLGVRDTLAFDNEAQYLVSRGYAVLKVNYRGSEGFGRDFFEAGYRARGKQIEDDIELALDHALAKYPLDPQRVGLVGASYGGYSALMGLVRSQRYRCAVAIAAPTDVALSFTAADWANSPETRALMTRLVGDPNKSLEDLVAISPLYQYEKLDRPLLLIHGLRDERVPIEHAERLRKTMALAGREPPVLYFNEGHGFTSLKAAAGSAIATAQFLDEHLGGRAVPLADFRADDAEPSVLTQKAAKYPPAAMKAGKSGTAKIEVSIAANGTVTDARVIESSGTKELDDAAVAAIREWTYRPKRVKGRDVASTLVVPVKFDLHDG